MPMTLNEMKVGMNDKVAEQVIDTFVRESEILEMLPFDNCVSPSGGSTLTYGYVQKKLPSSTAFRAINSEYAPSQATTEKKTTKKKYCIPQRLHLAAIRQVKEQNGNKY